MERGNVATLSLVVLALVGSACSRPACPQDDVDLGPTSPRLEHVDLLEKAVPGDPWEVVFAAKFKDGDGDLAAGNAEVYLNGRDNATVIDLAESFRRSALAPGSRAGTVTLALRFADTVDDGANVLMGIQLVDAAGQRSNCYRFDLSFDVKSRRARIAARACARFADG